MILSDTSMFSSCWFILPSLFETIGICLFMDVFQVEK